LRSANSADSWDGADPTVNGTGSEGDPSPPAPAAPDRGKVGVEDTATGLGKVLRVASPDGDGGEDEEDGPLNTISRMAATSVSSTLRFRMEIGSAATAGFSALAASPMTTAAAIGSSAVDKAMGESDGAGCNDAVDG